MEAFRRCKNVAVKIFEIECIFGLDWTVDVICPWILDTIDLETSLGVAKRHRLEASVTSVRCSPRMQHLSGPEATPSTKTICPPKTTGPTGRKVSAEVWGVAAHKKPLALSSCSRSHFPEIDFHRQLDYRLPRHAPICLAGRPSD
jgi:hypothetical protein